MGGGQRGCDVDFRPSEGPTKSSQVWLGKWSVHLSLQTSLGLTPSSAKWLGQNQMICLV